MSSLSGQALHERARSLLALIDGLRIENDLLSARRTLDDWRTEMSSLINSIHLSTTNKLDSLTGRLKQLKERRSTSLREDVLPSLQRTVVERRKPLSEQDLKEMETKIGKVDGELQGFGRLLKKIDSDEKQLIEQMELLKKLQRDNAELSRLDSTTTATHRFSLDTCYSPHLALSDDQQHMLIEDDNHLVLFDGQRRINEIPWQQQRDDSCAGSIKDLAYSNYLQQFCILSALNFFTLDPQMSALEKSEQIRASTGSHFQSVACLSDSPDIYLALTTSGARTNIERWSLLSGSLVKRWYHDIFESDDRLILSIRANETCLAVSIKPEKRESGDSHYSHSYWRVDLFDFKLVRMHRGVNLKVGGLGTYITPFDDRSWLVTNSNDIWLLGEQGECIEEKTFDQREKLHNVIVRGEDLHGHRQFILKLGKPAELRIL